MTINNKQAIVGESFEKPSDIFAKLLAAIPVVIPKAKDRFSGDADLPTTAKIGPKPLPAIPNPINTFKN